jgi:hypothetical protein
MQAKASRNRVICAGCGVPEGWVVIGHCHNAACGEGGTNALVIKIPGRREVVCADSPIPDSHQRLRSAHSDSCPGEGENAILIGRIDE